MIYNSFMRNFFIAKSMEIIAKAKHYEYIIVQLNKFRVKFCSLIVQTKSR